MCDFTKYEGKVKIANSLTSQVFKDECLICFDNAEMTDGIFVCLETFYGFDKIHMLDYFKVTGRSIYLNVIREEVIEETEPKEKIKKMAIGISGGFQINKIAKFVEKYKLVILPEFVKFSISNDEIPQFIMNSIDSIIKCESVIKLSELENEKFSWDGEMRVNTKHLNIKQLPNPPKIDLTHTNCEKCDFKENLWLNLSDGKILCGRKNFDGTGGNNHALEHYNLTKYPLSVKIGTITKNGADVYSYDENDMVEDLNLAQHLMHFNIRMDELEKTDKTISELEIEMNENYKEWAAIQESSQNLKPIYGKGYTGIFNLGNTCYISSILQVIFSLSPFIHFYYDNCVQTMLNNLKNPVDDYNFQTSKVSYGLLSGKYSIPPTSDGELVNHNGIKPKLFNLMIKKSYSEFRNNKQQDAHEFFLHFMNQMEKNNYNKPQPSNLFKLSIEEKWQCQSTLKVKYTKKVENYISLMIPLNKATNKAEYDQYLLDKTIQIKVDKVFAKINFTEVLKHYFAPETIKCSEDLLLSKDDEIIKINRMSTFPKYLLFHMKRYIIDKSDSGWLPKKLDASIEDVPLQLNLEEFMAKGPQPSEILMAANESFVKPANFVNSHYLGQLKEMGFTQTLCEKGLTNTNNTSVEDAFNWIIQNLDEPIKESQQPSEGSAKPVSEEHIAAIVDMGFSIDHAKKALQSTEDNIERAMDWLFSHQDELLQDTTNQAPLAASSNHVNEAESSLDNGKPVYRLVGCVSHIGNTLNSGHYVAHILKDGKWVIYNDNYVALSEHPPLNLAYLYFYERI